MLRTLCRLYGQCVLHMHTLTPKRVLYDYHTRNFGNTTRCCIPRSLPGKLHRNLHRLVLSFTLAGSFLAFHLTHAMAAAFSICKLLHKSGKAVLSMFRQDRNRPPMWFGPHPDSSGYPLNMLRKIVAMPRMLLVYTLVTCLVALRVESIRRPLHRPRHGRL